LLDFSRTLYDLGQIFTTKVTCSSFVHLLPRKTKGRSQLNQPDYRNYQAWQRQIIFLQWLTHLGHCNPAEIFQLLIPVLVFWEGHDHIPVVIEI